MIAAFKFDILSGFVAHDSLNGRSNGGAWSCSSSDEVDDHVTCSEQNVPKYAAHEAVPHLHM